ncbi:MAG: hypothetical protein ABFC84_00490 [Veillonellales bacterium]
MLEGLRQIGDVTVVYLLDISIRGNTHFLFPIFFGKTQTSG